MHQLIRIRSWQSFWQRPLGAIGLKDGSPSLLHRAIVGDQSQRWIVQDSMLASPTSASSLNLLAHLPPKVRCSAAAPLRSCQGPLCLFQPFAILLQRLLRLLLLLLQPLLKLLEPLIWATNGAVSCQGGQSYERRQEPSIQRTKQLEEQRRQWQQNGVPAAGASGSGTKAERPVAAAAASACFLAVETSEQGRAESENPSEIKCARRAGLTTTARRLPFEEKTDNKTTARKQQERGCHLSAP